MARNAAVYAFVAIWAIAAPLAAQHATEAEPNDNASTATLVQLGDTVSGTVAYNNLDYFAVDLAAGTKLQLVVLDGRFCHGFMLVGVRENDCFSESGPHDTINYRVPATGRYYFSIWHQDETPSDGERPPIPYRMRAAAYESPAPGPGNPLRQFASGVDGIGAWVATPGGSLIISHNNRLDWMAPDGHVSKFADGGGAQLAVDAFGDLLVEAGPEGVWRYSLATGERSQFAPAPGSEFGYQGIAVGADGDVWVSELTVVNGRATGSLLTRFDALGSLKEKVVLNGLNVGAITMSQQGELFFISEVTGDLYRLVNNTTPQRVIAANSAFGENRFSAVLLDQDGWVYLVQPERQRLVLYDAQYQLAHEPLAWINDSTGWKRMGVTSHVWMRDRGGTMTDRMLVGRFAGEMVASVEVLELNHSGMGAPGADPMLHIAQKNLRNGSAGSSYADTLHLQQGSSSQWTVVSGDLPKGLSLSSDGVISGTPTDKGDAKFTVRAADGARAGFGRFTVTVGTATALEVDATALSSATLGKSYTDTLHVKNATGGGVTWSVSTGKLPPGISLTSSSGLVAGLATDTGSFAFTVKATSGAQTASAQFTILVTPVAVATDDIVSALFGDKTLAAEIVAFLDLHGNHNGQLDVGDLRAFLRASGVLQP